MPDAETPLGLQLILAAMAYIPVRTVYLQSQRTGHDVLLAVEQPERRPVDHDLSA
jgi:hypothetical protein